MGDHSFKKSIASKFGSYLLWTALAFIIFYLIGSAFNFIPQPVQDIVTWGADNFTQISFFLCFVIGAYLVNKFLNHKKVNQ
jgi:ABC-type transport system involved in multi-copper enzyme maturation permease subunit